jgi:indole-3-glycerol phosphate synthase
METYKLIQKIENDNYFLSLLQKGIVSISILTKKVYYEAYLSEVKKVNKTQAISNVAEDYKVSDMSIRRAINFMES